MRDPYGVLGVHKNANEAAIKCAYRRLAKKLHPDANKQDKNAATKFAELNAAYEILGDADKRKAFDRGEIDAEGKPRFRGFEGFGGGPRTGTGGFGRDGQFETFTWGPDGTSIAPAGAVQAAAPASAASTRSSKACSAAPPVLAAAPRSSPRISAKPRRPATSPAR